MADEARERMPATIHGLIEAMDRFSSDNAYAKDVNHRWLAVRARQWLAVAYAVRNNRLEGLAAEVAEFRLREIADKRNDLQRQIASLDAEAEKLSKPASAAPNVAMAS